MEILSIGDKIRRLRIYKGLRLKELTNSKLSISKVSAIENNKIIPDDESVEFFAQKLGTTVSYLNKSISEQIYENIDNLDTRDINCFNVYKKNLSIAMERGLMDVAFYICHNVFNKISNININLDNEIIKLIPLYLDVVISLKDIEKINVYYNDLSIYFFNKGEYKICLNYCLTLRRMNYCLNNSINLVAEVFLRELYCYLYLGDYRSIYESKDIILNYIYSNNDDGLLYDFIQFKIILGIKYDTYDIGEYNSILNTNTKDKLRFMYNLSLVFKSNGNLDECINLCNDMYKIIYNYEIALHREKIVICGYLNYVCHTFLENSILDNIDIILDKCFILCKECEDIKMIMQYNINKLMYGIYKKDIEILDKHLGEILSYRHIFKYNIDEYKARIIEVIFMMYYYGYVDKSLFYFDILLNE